MGNRCPNIVIRHSAEIDVSVVKATLSYAKWYVEHGYVPQLPGGVYISDIGEGTEEALLNRAEKEYDEHFYQDVGAAITKQWKKYAESWPGEKVEKMGIDFASEYIVCLTSYGVGATYNEREGVLMLNVCNADATELASIIFHELIHLAIESDIQKYNIGHWQKERLVDLIFEQLLPNMCFEQKLPEEAYSIDPFFEKSSGEVRKTMVDFVLVRR